MHLKDDSYESKLIELQGYGRHKLKNDPVLDTSKAAPDSDIVSDQKPSLELRRSQRRKRIGDDRFKRKPDRTPDETSSFSGDSTASARHTPPLGSLKASQSLLLALESSSTANGVAAFMIGSANKPNGSQTASHIAQRIHELKSPALTLFRNAAANRVQLKASFHDIYYPKALATSFCPTHFLLFNSNQTSDIRLAEHALYLAQMGTTSKDERAIKEALRVYQASIIQLRRRISQPQATLNEQVFVVAHLLRLCELYTHVSAEESGESRHHDGIGQLLVAKGPRCIKSLPLEISLQMYQQSQLWELVVRRKGGKTCSPEWLQVLANDEKCKWKLPQLTSFVLRLPGILERVQRILDAPIRLPDGDIINTLSDVKNFERELREWMKQWYIENPEVPYRNVQADKCAWVEPLIDKDLRTVFPSSFDFPGTATAKAHQIFWMALLASSEAVRDLSALLTYPLPPSLTFEEQDTRLVDEINESADNLCMDAVYMCQPENGVDSWIDACYSLQFAAIWYERFGAVRKAAWCGGLVKGIERRGIRAPRLSRPIF